MDEFEPNGKKNTPYTENPGVGQRNKTYYGSKQFSEIGPYGGSGKKKSYGRVKTSRIQDAVKTVSKGLAVAAAGIIIVEASTAFADPESFIRDVTDPIPGPSSPSSIEEIIRGGDEHIWDDGIVLKEASCIEKGTMLYTCNICGETREEEIPLGDHVRTAEAAVEATCTEDGHTEIIVCSVCGKVLDEGSVLTALGHSFGPESVVREATCTQTGLREAKCIRCDEKKQTSIAALGHNFGPESVLRAAGCTYPGLMQSVCLRCGLATQRYVAATGHVDRNRDYICDVCDEMVISLAFVGIDYANEDHALLRFRVTSLTDDWSVDFWPTSDQLGLEGGQDGTSDVLIYTYFWDADYSPQTFFLGVYVPEIGDALISSEFQVSGRPENLSVTRIH